MQVKIFIVVHAAYRTILGEGTRQSDDQKYQEIFLPELYSV